MEQNRPLRKDLMEAWNRLVDHTWTISDIALLLDSLNGDDHLQEFEEVYERVRIEALANTPPLTKEREKTYRKEAIQLLAEYERKRGVKPTPVLSPTTRHPFRRIWYAAAAAILLGILIPAAYYFSKPKTEQIAVRYIEESTLRGEIRTVILPDNSTVTLNAGSALKYPESFRVSVRSVELYGEALFEVTSDPVRPFTVKTEKMNIKVVGTVFDVKEYADDRAASVSVVSGKVEVGMVGARVTLEQNQQVKIDKTTGNHEKTTIDAGNQLLWTNGTLYFHFTPIQEVIQVLNRHYSQVEIKLAEGDYSTIQISGKYENIYTAEEILNSIVYITGLKCKKTGNKFTLYN